MNSLSKKCQEAKEKYDACFNSWFSERYLKGHTEDECEPLFKVYQKCIKVGLKVKTTHYVIIIFKFKALKVSNLNLHIFFVGSYYWAQNWAMEPPEWIWKNS